MKVLQINCVYPNGSTGRIVKDIHFGLLNEGVSSVVCFGRGSKNDEPHVFKLCSEMYAKCNNLASRFTGIMYGGCLFSTLKLINIIKSEKPDIVHLHCINGYFVNIYRLIAWLNKKRIKTVLTLHSEFMYTGNCGHAFDCNKWLDGCRHCYEYKRITKSIFFNNTSRSFELMRRAFEGFENIEIVSVSPWLMCRANKSLILKSFNHRVVLNGVDINSFFYRENVASQKLVNVTEKIILHVTAFFSDAPEHSKGGAYLIELAKKMKDQPVKFIVAGKFTCNGDLPGNMVFLGPITDKHKLAKLYSIANVTVLTSRKETFSMPVAESLCCGTPVVGFKAGAPEMISIPEYCSFVEYGNLDALHREINRFINKQFDAVSISREAQQLYSASNMFKEYMKIYNELLNRN